jgi:hypothetical protein
MSLAELLQRAVSKGIISVEQQAALLELDSSGTAAGRELPRGFNWVTIAYAIGALLVVFAGGWFLAQRWLTLGAPGVLAVSLGYSVVAMLASSWLARNRFPEAAGVSAMVAVSLTPVTVWALESLSGLWPIETWGQPYYPAFPAAEASRWAVAELSTILVALVWLRSRTWSALVLPIAIALFGLVVHLPRAILDITPLLDRWLWLTGALAVCSIADTVDRRTSREKSNGQGDMAFPLWLVGLLALATSILSFWPTAGVWRHALPVVALGAVAVSLVIGRRSHLVFGVAMLFMYLRTSPARSSAPRPTSP